MTVSEKKQARLLLKSNEEVYEQPKRMEGGRKRLDKQRKVFVINHPNLDLVPSQTSFKNSAVKSRTIKKVEKSLPQSPTSPHPHQKKKKERKKKWI